MQHRQSASLRRSCARFRRAPTVASTLCGSPLPPRPFPSDAISAPEQIWNLYCTASADMDAGASSMPDRIPSLDGLRAISIVLVLFGHLAGTRGFPVPTSLGNFLSTAELGVHIFFVISGFLITQLLLDELARKQRIAVGRFYLRRTLRIFPPYYVFIGAMVLAQVAGWIALAPQDPLRALTYTTNYDEARSWYVGHTWSLSVEEQFYLLWPAVLLLARTRRAILI